jgi:hypothetical protein
MHRHGLSVRRPTPPDQIRAPHTPHTLTHTHGLRHSAGVPGGASSSLSSLLKGRGEELIVGVGLRPVLVGDLDQVHLVDTPTALWAALAYGQGRGRHLAFKVPERAPGAG